MNHALAVQHVDVFGPNATADQQLHASDSRCASSEANHFGFIDFLTLQLQGIDHARSCYDRGAMLVIMEDGYTALFDQRTFDFKALRGLNVLKIDTAEGISNTLDRFNECLGAFGIDLDIEHINSSKALEQYAFAFHNRLARQRTEVTQTEDCSAV